MNSEELVISSSPHVRDEETVLGIMWKVVLALIPATAWASYYFGTQTLSIVGVCIVVCTASEYVFQKIRGIEITISDGSAVLTGLLLALTLPPAVPLWTAAIGALVSIILGKQVFGGLGSNPFNPALVGRAFITASYPVIMTTWTVDGETMATPLAQYADGVRPEYWDLFIGNVAGSLGETSAFFLLLGAAYLIYSGVLNWRIPAGMIVTVMVFTGIIGHDPLFHLLAGSLILGAFYMATDMVTTPVTPRGRWIFGIGAGFLVVLIRVWGGYEEGVMYAILLMNMTVPLVDRFSRPKSLGEVE